MKESNDIPIGLKQNLAVRFSHPIYTHLKSLDFTAIKKLLDEGFDPNFASSQNHLLPLEYMISHLRLTPYSSGKYRNIENIEQFRSAQYQIAKLLIESGAKISHESCLNIIFQPFPMINIDIAMLIAKPFADIYIAAKSSLINKLPTELISKEILEHFVLINFCMPEQIEQVEHAEKVIKSVASDNLPINLMTKYSAHYNGVMSICDLILESANLYVDNSDNEYMNLMTSFVNVGLMFKYLHPAFAAIAPVNLGINLYYGTQDIEDFSYIATQSIAIGMLKFAGSETIVSLAFSAAITLSVMNKAMELYNNLTFEEVEQGTINTCAVNFITSFNQFCPYEEYEEAIELGSVANTEDIL
jgi:hypothetical protein